MFDLNKTYIGVIGLGYVGLPLATAFAAEFPTIGFDIDESRIAELHERMDRTREVSSEELNAASRLRYSTDPEQLRAVNFYVVTVPTPLDGNRLPDLTPLREASEIVGAAIDAGDVVVFESTVYPGATEEQCIPVIERASGLRYNRDFFAGYSPERVNPGDREHRVADILKVTSGSTPEVAEYVDAVYRKVIRAGTWRASSIRVAEAAKVIENTQRSVNIAFINELAMLFSRLGLDTREVLEAAATKWNFLPFTPGLVGGHCIGVDPRYLVGKANEAGFDPEIILAGCRANDLVALHVADRIKALLESRQIPVAGARVLVLGLTFKENCPDVRDSRVVDILARLRAHGMVPEVWDPWSDPGLVKREYDIDLLSAPEAGAYDAIVVAVAHREFVALGEEGIRAFGKAECVIYDVKGVLPKSACDERL